MDHRGCSVAGCREPVTSKLEEYSCLKDIDLCQCHILTLSRSILAAQREAELLGIKFDREHLALREAQALLFPTDPPRLYLVASNV